MKTWIPLALLALIARADSLSPGEYWNKAQGKTSLTISHSLELATSLTVNNASSGEKAKLSFPHPLEEVGAHSYAARGDFAMTYWGDFGFTRCWFPAAVRVTPIEGEPGGIEAVFTLPQRFGVDRWGFCFDLGKSDTRMHFFKER